MYLGMGNLKDGEFVKGRIANGGPINNACFCDYGEGDYYTTLEYVTTREIEKKVGLFKTVVERSSDTKSYDMILCLINNCTQVKDCITGDVFDIAESYRVDSPHLQVDITDIRTQHEVAEQMQKMDDEDIEKYKKALSLVKRDIKLSYDERNKQSQQDADVIANFCKKIGR